MSTKPPTLPGFNAEAVFYRTSGHYRSVANPSYGTGEHGVVPQRPTGCAKLEIAMSIWLDRAGMAAANGYWYAFHEAMLHVDQASEVYALAGC